jgi:hypothetical protein
MWSLLAPVPGQAGDLHQPGEPAGSAGSPRTGHHDAAQHRWSTAASLRQVSSSGTARSKDDDIQAAGRHIRARHWRPQGQGPHAERVPHVVAICHNPVPIRPSMRSPTGKSPSAMDIMFINQSAIPGHHLPCTQVWRCRGARETDGAPTVRSKLQAVHKTSTAAGDSRLHTVLADGEFAPRWPRPCQSWPSVSVELTNTSPT